MLPRSASPATYTRRHALTAVAALPFSTGVLATAAVASDPKPYTLSNSQVIDFQSAINAVNYRLLVRLPHSVGAETKTYPLVITLDADYSFPIAAAQLEHLADRSSQVPSAILVSIGYQDAYPDVAKYRLNRTRDYTPVHVAEGGYGPQFQAQSGGAARFASVIRGEILPLIEQRFPIDRTNRTLVGHSYGGLFAGWMLQQQPDLFRRYLIVSPSIWYADKFLIRTERDLGFIVPDQDILAYLAVGTNEEQPENGRAMVSDLRLLADLLGKRSRQNVRTRVRVFEDETHASIFPAAFSSGIRALFGDM